MWILWDKENYNYQNQLSDVQVDANFSGAFNGLKLWLSNIFDIESPCSEFLSKTYLWWPLNGDSKSNKNCIKRINCNIWYIWKIMCSKACCDKHDVLMGNHLWLILLFSNTKVGHISLSITWTMQIMNNRFTWKQYKEYIRILARTTIYFAILIYLAEEFVHANFQNYISNVNTSNVAIYESYVFTIEITRIRMNVYTYTFK